jgi:hypothetical protein
MSAALTEVTGATLVRFAPGSGRCDDDLGALAGGCVRRGGLGGRQVRKGCAADHREAILSRVAKSQDEQGGVAPAPPRPPG